ncbi:MAG: galactokinase, partial [Treponema sp.]|nr:galactokinase [Treponema sp.]
DRSTPIAYAQAPGRIHFLGGQGEPEANMYLSAAINRFINVTASMRKDNSFRFFALNLKERKRSTLANLKYKREDRWANHLKPAISMFIKLGYPMKGINFTFGGDIPQQIALASSTAIEVATATALRSLLRVQISDIDLALKLKTSHDSMFEGTVLSNTSFADYLVCIMARKDQFLLIDNSAGEARLVKAPLTGFKILLVDSRVPRLGTGVEAEITSRQSDILKGLELLSFKQKGLCFKDFAPADLIEALGNFPEQIRRRSMHIVEEIHRVNDAAAALERCDLASFAKIIYHSHESLRDLYEISCPEIDWLVKRSQEIEGAAGSRMIGPGFGGCTYTIIRRELVEEYKKRMEEYERIFGFRPVIYEIKLAARAKIIKLN